MQDARRACACGRARARARSCSRAAAEGRSYCAAEDRSRYPTAGRRFRFGTAAGGALNGSDASRCLDRSQVGLAGRGQIPGLI